jgi:hypothetical protein
MADEMERDRDEILLKEDTPSKGVSSGIDPEAIARRAHERYERRGGEHGRDQEDWLEAERELIAARFEEE